MKQNNIIQQIFVDLNNNNKKPAKYNILLIVKQFKIQKTNNILN